MKTFFMAAGLAAAVFLTGCHSLPPGAEPGPHRTMAYEVLIEASDPGAKMEVNGEYIGNTPIRLKLFGDPDGTFHDFGSPYYVIRALPMTTNQFVQTRVFGTGHMFGREDRIPERLHFDMNQNTPVYANPGYPPPSMYYGPPPIYYPEPYYYGPSFRFHFGPRYHRRW
ncbi:MAG TPA: hypothetical protein VK530_20515 [Candidatus Acidoferrum sp.]|nr:hypothetical protein [Candidatus Acidoferrum sp.]